MIESNCSDSLSIDQHISNEVGPASALLNNGIGNIHLYYHQISQEQM